MNLEKQALIIDSIRETMAGYLDQRLKVRANMGRSKIIESEGVLTQVHPQLFVMEVDRKRGRTARQSYQYVDILTGTVEMFQNGEPIFEGFDFENDEEELDVYDSLAPLDGRDEEIVLL